MSISTYPDHVPGRAGSVLARQVRDLGLEINGLAMRYYSNPAFKIGAFTNPDPAVRREAIDLTKRGIDAAREMGTAVDDAVAGAGRFRLCVPGRLSQAVAGRDRRHPRGLRP